jgi:putative toxin-antitoxin system antitoxin component (TIGR02293 family)
MILKSGQMETISSKQTGKVLATYKSMVLDDFTLATQAIEGVDANLFYDMVDITGLSKDVLAEYLDISTKTLDRYKKQHKKLNSFRSEVLLKLVTLYKKGLEIFGDIHAFRTWLNKPAYGLDHERPAKLMITSTGIDVILDELIRIEHGDLA